MSFSVPKHVPTFTSAQRRLEDSTWGSSGTVHTHRSNGVGDKINDFFDKRELPMYKDKPYAYAASGKFRPLWRRKRVLAGALVLFLTLSYWLGAFSRLETSQSSLQKPPAKSWSWFGMGKAQMVDWTARRERVKEAFILSWDAYDRYAWGMSNVLLTVITPSC